MAANALSRARAPFVWAQAHYNLGTAVADVARQEIGTARLTEAVATIQLALEVWTADQHPHDWAVAIGTQGVALTALAERTLDCETARRARNQIEVAATTMRKSGHVPNAEHYEKALDPTLRLIQRLENS